MSNFCVYVSSIFFASQESKWSKVIYAAKTVKIRVPIWGMPRRRRMTRNAGWSPHALALVCAEMAGARANCPARPWYCYLLVNRNNNNTYVGATVNVPRRYRQHMGWLSGGARVTSRFKTWRLSMYVPLYSKTAALQSSSGVRNAPAGVRAGACSSKTCAPRCRPCPSTATSCAAQSLRGRALALRNIRTRRTRRCSRSSSRFDWCQFHLLLFFSPL